MARNRGEVFPAVLFAVVLLGALFMGVVRQSGGSAKAMWNDFATWLTGVQIGRHR